MPKTKKKKKIQVIKSIAMDGSLPVMDPPTIKISANKKKKKKYNVEEELENTRMDMIQ
ncbi:MAG: hypothetical protein Q8N08_07450 [Methanobacteriaceae archaeon]|nr:hypothetical protein [Methanobacteriaceae archaeon]